KLGMPLEKVRKVLKIAKEPLSLETPSQMGWAWDFRSVARSSKPMEDGCGRPGTHQRVRSFSLRYLLGRRDQPMVLLQPVRARCAAPALQTASLLGRRITSSASPAGASGFGRVMPGVHPLRPSRAYASAREAVIPGSVSHASRAAADAPAEAACWGGRQCAPLRPQSACASQPWKVRDAIAGRGCFVSSRCQPFRYVPVDRLCDPHIPRDSLWLR